MPEIKYLIKSSERATSSTPLSAPLSIDDVKKLIRSGELKPEDLVQVIEVDPFQPGVLLNAGATAEQKASDLDELKPEFQFLKNKESGFHDEATVIHGASSESMFEPRQEIADDEKTVIKAKEPSKEFSIEFEKTAVGDKIHFESASEQISARSVSQEKTAMLSMPKKDKPRLDKKKKIFVVVAVIAAFALLFMPDDSKKKSATLGPFKVQLPSQTKIDPELSTKELNAALPFYVKDTVDGYQRAASFLLQASEHDLNNVRALCLLASSYINLFDVLERNENYFNTVTKLIEMARAKNVDLTEVVIADVELYLILGNPDAAIQRVVEFSKMHPYGPELYFYLAQSYFEKGDFDNAFRYLSHIEAKNWFSPKVPYLYGLLYLQTEKTNEAIKAFQNVIERSPTHTKARIELAEIYFENDQIDLAKKEVDVLLEKPGLSSKTDLSRAYYLSSRIKVASSKDKEAIIDIETALKNKPDEPEYLLEYFSIQARLGGGDAKSAKGKARMFAELANAEKSIQKKNLNDAIRSLLTARQAQEKDPLPLVRLSQVFMTKGDYQTAKTNMAKAVKLMPSKKDLYPRYIRLLIDVYEFDEAKRNIDIFKGLSPSEFELDLINGYFYYRQQRLKEAQAYLKRAVGNSNATAEAYLYYAEVMYLGQVYQDAAFFFGLSTRFDPYRSEAVIGVAKALIELESLQRGIDYLNDRLKGYPEDKKVELIQGKAELYLKKGDYQSAIQTADEAIAKNPDYAKSYKTKAEAMASLDKNREALDLYLTFSNLAPQDPTGSLERYKLFMKKLNFKEARAAIERVIQAYPRYPGAYYQLAEMYRESQNLKGAFEAAQMEVKNNPMYLPAYVLAGAIYNTNKEYNKALETLNIALKLDPNNVPALIQAGDANRSLKSYAAAKALLMRALSLDQGNPQIHKRLGVLYIEMGDMTNARSHIRAYIDLYPDAPDRAEMEKYLGR